MKVVINKCFGGFGLSPRAVKRLAELNGRPCYFYVDARKADGSLDFGKHQLATIAEAENAFMFHAFDVPNIDEVLPESRPDADGTYKTFNAAYSSHRLDDSNINRSDPKLIQVVEELGGGHGEGASGQHAQLAIVEIPDGTDWEISEYDGLEHVAEKHQTWG